MTGNLIVRTDLMPSIKLWFPTSIYEVNLGDEFISKGNEYYNKGLEYKNTTPVIDDWNNDTYMTLNTVNLCNVELFQPLIQKCREHVINFSKHFGVETHDIRCIDSWINIAAPGNYQEYHVHPKHHFSLSYYVKTPKNCGDLLFRSYDSNNMLPLPIDNPSFPGFTNTRYTPEEGKLIIFRSNLYHMVRKNMSNEDRVSISMNFTIY